MLGGIGGFGALVEIPAGYHHPVLVSGTDSVENNFGELRSASLGDRLWVDTNGDGQQNDGATGISGAQLAAAELSARSDGPICHREILIITSCYLGRPVLIAEYGLDALGRDRGYGSHRAYFPGNGLGIGLLERDVA